MPSADAVGSKEQLSFARARIHASTMAVIEVASRIKLPIPVVRTKPQLRGIIMENMVRSAESAVSRRVLVKLIKLYAKLSVTPNAVVIAHMEMSSMGMRMDPGISSRRTALERRTKSVVRAATEA
jgi:hypothetical protein